MNENIDLTKILKDCPKGTKFYSPLFGEVTLYCVEQKRKTEYPIKVKAKLDQLLSFSKEGIYYTYCENSECILFPSKDQRDWSKFKPKKSKFDPKALKPFDKVITKISSYPWKCNIFSYTKKNNKSIVCYCMSEDYIYDKCIPYNEDTKHLVGTTEEAPEYYRYWEE